MKSRSIILLSVLLTLGLGGTATGQPENHDQGRHEAHTGAGLDLERPETGKWASDQSLRQGMRDLKAAFEPAHDAYRNDSFDAHQATALADTVEARVNFMIANCQLPSDADAELHKLLAAALAAAEALRTGGDFHDGLHQLHQVLKTYGQYFEHPGWAG